MEEFKMVTLISEEDGLVFGVDTEAEISSLPTTEIKIDPIVYKILPWSLALVGATGGVYYFNGTVWTKFGS